MPVSPVGDVPTKEAHRLRFVHRQMAATRAHEQIRRIRLQPGISDLLDRPETGRLHGLGVEPRYRAELGRAFMRRCHAASCVCSGGTVSLIHAAKSTTQSAVMSAME